jgi:Flp pilus assembly pilin Flp
MRQMRNFWRNEHGSGFENMALALSVIAVMFVAGADLLNHASKKDGFLARAFATRPAPDAVQAAGPRSGVDYTTTGSIIGLRRPVLLQPCTGEEQK